MRPWTVFLVAAVGFATFSSSAAARRHVKPTVIRPNQRITKNLPAGPKILVIGTTSRGTFGENRLGIRLGRAIAGGGGVLMTGGGPGLSYAAARGAHGRGGATVCVSPFRTMRQVRQSSDPQRGFTHFCLTKVPKDVARLGVKGTHWAYRQLHNTAVADAVVVTPGHGGTIGELGNALVFKRPIAVLDLPGPEGARFSRAMRALRDYHVAGKSQPPIKFFKSPEKLASWVLEQAAR